MYDEWSDLFIAKNELNEPNSLTVKKIIGPSEIKKIFYSLLISFVWFVFEKVLEGTERPPFVSYSYCEKIRKL